MDEKRELEILRAYVKYLIRKNFSLNQIGDLKRRIGNLVGEPELSDMIMKESELSDIKATQEEILVLAGRYLSEVFDFQMRKAGLSRTTYL